MADYIFTQNGDGNVQIGDMTGMPHHVNIAFKWALEHNYQSVAAQYARTLALEVERLRDENDRLCAALKLAKARAADMEAEVERLNRAREDANARASAAELAERAARAENDGYKADIEVERLRARWEETASDNTDYHLSHSDGIYTVSDQSGHVVCEFIRAAEEAARAALGKGETNGGSAMMQTPRNTVLTLEEVLELRGGRLVHLEHNGDRGSAQPYGRNCAYTARRVNHCLTLFEGDGRDPIEDRHWAPKLYPEHYGKYYRVWSIPVAPTPDELAAWPWEA